MHRSRPRHLLSLLFAVASPFLWSASPTLAGADDAAPPEHPLARISSVEAYRIRPSLRVLLGSKADASLEASMQAATARLVEAAETRPSVPMTATLVLADALRAADVVAFEQATGLE